MDLKEVEIDFFKELASIGSGSAATSLSKILNKSVYLNVPNISLLDYSEIFERLGEPDKKTISTLASINAPTIGLMMMILDIEGTNYILNSLGLSKLEQNDVTIHKLEESALTEISNIIFNSYLSALSTLTKETISSGKPFSLFDMLGAVLNYPINVMPEKIEEVILMDTEFKIDNRKINTTLMLITNHSNLKKYMKVFGI